MRSLADLFGGRASTMQTGTVALVLAADRYQVTDAGGRRSEVRSATILRLGEQVLHQNGVVVKTAGLARPMKTYNV